MALYLATVLYKLLVVYLAQALVNDEHSRTGHVAKSSKRVHCGEKIREGCPELVEAAFSSIRFAAVAACTLKH
jgi:hypothetical protein